MIIPMKKAYVYGLSQDGDRLIQRMMQLGCVQVGRPEEMAGEAVGDALQKRPVDLYDLEQKYSRVSASIAALRPYFPKEGLLARKPRETYGRLADPGILAEAFSLCSQVEAEQRRIAELRSQIGKLEFLRTSLAPWLEGDLPLSLEGTVSTTVEYLFFSAESSLEALRAKLEEEKLCPVIQQISADKDQQYLLMVSLKKERGAVWEVLRNFGASRCQLDPFDGPPGQYAQRCTQEIAACQRQIEEGEERLKALAEKGPQLKLAFDSLTVQLDCAKACQKLCHTEKTFLLTAWVPEEKIPQLEKLLEEFPCYLEIAEPGPEEEPPVLLRNSKLVEPFEVITEMYSLPSPHGVDPNPAVAIFYFIFFGMMLSDAGYGLILFFGGLFALKKMDLSPFARKFMKVITLGGLSTVFWGALYGSWFGNLVSQFSLTFMGREITVPMLLDPLNDPITILAISFVLGALHLFCGMGYKAYLLIRRGHPWDALFDIGFWYMVLVGLPMLVLPGLFRTIGICLSVAGAAGLILTQGRDKKNPISRLISGVMSLYDITSYISDLLSYSRILALGLATAVIGNVVNIMGTLAGGGIVGFVLFVAIFLFGHAMNLGINALGSYVHSSRLQYVEFFGKFYESGGKPFQPLRANTKYVVVTDKED